MRTYLYTDSHAQRSKSKGSKPLLWALFFIFSLIAPFTAIAEEALLESQKQGIFLTAPSPSLSYAELMREFRAIQTSDSGDADNKSSAQSLDARREQLSADLEKFIKNEKERLSALVVPTMRQIRYFQLLKSQVHSIGGSLTIFDKIIQYVKNQLLGMEDEIRIILDEVKDKNDDVLIPQYPGMYKTVDATDKVYTASHIIGVLQQGQSVPDTFKKLLSIGEVNTDDADPDLPTLATVTADGKEIILTQNIRELASRLNNDPVEIFNFVRNEIVYEPYTGAKKGNNECLAQKRCNDVDTASLLVSLYRAAGIPARYQKSLIALPAEQVRRLLGVDETKTAYDALSKRGIPVCVVSEDRNDTVVFSTFDFSKAQMLCMEWTYVEVFYEYDERGAHFPNTLDLSLLESDNALAKSVSRYQKKQWIPVDAAMKTTVHTKKDILPEVAKITAEEFRDAYLKSSNDGPLASYLEQYIAGKTGGKKITLPEYQSTTTIEKQDFSILPPALPYFLAKEGSIGEKQVVPETWTSVPDERRLKVVISLKKDSDKSAVFEKSYFGSEIGASGIDVSYHGASDVDIKVIEEYGGIHQTPSALAQIVPRLDMAGMHTAGTVPFSIGEQLILRMTFVRGEKELFKDEKFSVAGNNEGIAISLGHIMKDLERDSPSEILLRGNASIAREFMRKIDEDGEFFSSVFDQLFTVEFGRAVVTQNRILSRVNGTPTTFDFKGLSIDASALISISSRRSAFDSNTREFSAVNGLNASNEEGQIFKNLAGLDAISTVKGLQYAYAHPEVYSVKTITSANVGDIDSLALSDNTKKNMRADIAKGHTIITPDKLVTKGEWRGILYMSVGSLMSTYAIGEQTSQNGGWTLSKANLEKLQHDITNNTLVSWQVKNDDAIYIYRDKFDSNINCRIKKTTFERIVNNKDTDGKPIIAGEAQWRARYGWPCIDDNPDKLYTFGSTDHSFIIATDGARFKSIAGNYFYWKTDENIEKLFKEAFVFIGPWYDKKDIKSYWGTYVYEIKLSDSLVREPKIYGLGIYNPEKRVIFKISDQMYQKYVSPQKIQDEYVPGHLGYPTGPLKRAAQSPTGLAGSFQQFANGTMYHYWTHAHPFAGNTYIVYGVWDDKHNKLDGTSGIGFPESDAGYSTTYGAVTQKFEKRICKQQSDIQCQDRTGIGDARHGMNGVIDTFGLMAVLSDMAMKNVFMPDYSAFLSGVDTVSDTRDNRVMYCRLFNTEQVNANVAEPVGFGLRQGDISSYAMLSCALFPQSIAEYRERKQEVRSRLTALSDEYALDEKQLSRIHDSLVTHAEKTRLSGTEWIGYFGADIMSLVGGPATKFGVSAPKVIAKAIIDRYVAELTLAHIDRKVMQLQLEKHLVQELSAHGAARASKAQFEAATERAFLSALSESGVEYITRLELKIPISSVIAFNRRMDFFPSFLKNGEKGSANIFEKTLLRIKKKIAEKKLSDQEKIELVKKELDDLPQTLGLTKKTNLLPGTKETPADVIILKGSGQYMVKTKNGKMLGQDGKPLKALGEADGWLDEESEAEVLAVTRDGIMFYQRAQTYEIKDGLKMPGSTINHAQLTGGLKVDGAFTLIFDKGGNLIRVTNLSGHYLPEKERIGFLLHTLQNSGVDLSKTRVTLYNRNTSGKAELASEQLYTEWLAALP